MDRFKIGDKVYTKEGDGRGKEIGTVCEITGDGKVGVRFYSDLSKREYFSPEEILNEDESKAKLNAWEASLPRNREVNLDPYD